MQDLSEFDIYDDMDFSKPIHETEEFQQTLQNFEEEFMAHGKAKGNQILANQFMNKLRNVDNFDACANAFLREKCWAARIPGEITTRALQQFILDSNDPLYQLVFISNETKMKKRHIAAIMLLCEELFGVAYSKSFDFNDPDTFINPKEIFNTIT